ncbi:MAG: hypothetical protein IJ017_07025 [Oscillospiraceae bacterium]|nr:hypothetical protein [Oscillospiraceae bacterium]
MQRKGTILTASAIGAGVIIAVLRFLNAGNYGADGLPSGGALSTLLSAAAIAAIAVSFIAAYLIGRKKDSEKDVFKSMSSKHSGISLLMQIIAAVLILVHAVLSYPTYPEIIKNHNAIALPLAILFAVSHVIVSVLIYKGKTRNITGIVGIFSPLYFCLQLGEIFYANMANPILPEYSYECLALGACALYLIAMAGSASGKDQVFNVIFTSLLALICAPASLAGPQLTVSRMLLYIAIILILLPTLPVFIKNLIKREKKKKKKRKTVEE